MNELNALNFYTPLSLPQRQVRDIVGLSLDFMRQKNRSWKVYGELTVSHLEPHEWRETSAFQELQNSLPGLELCLASLFRVGSGKRLKPHRDYRQFALNFPLQGDFSAAPLKWYKLRNSQSSQKIIQDKIASERGENSTALAEIPYFHESECICLATYEGEAPILLNTQELHGVDNSHGQTDRLVLSLSGPREESYFSALARINTFPELVDAGH